MRNYLFILLFALCTKLMAQTPEYGLHIQTFPHPSHEFTSLALDNGLPIKISGKPTIMDFKLFNREEMVFGAVFRIVTDKNKTIDLMYTVTDNDTRFPQLVVDGAISQIHKTPRLGTWIDVSLVFDPKKEKVSLEYDGTRIEADAPGFSQTESIRVFFGTCPITALDLNDIASVNIKDVSLSSGDKKIREWDMKIHHGDTCYDKINNHIATAVNARWLIDNHIIWKKIYEKEFPNPSSITYDPESSNFYIVSDNSNVHVFNSRTNEESDIPANGGEYAATYPNSIMYIPEYDIILSWNLDQNTWSGFHFHNGKWDNETAPVPAHKEYYWNNSVTWNPQEKEIISFGGYGHYQFNNELIISKPSLSPKTQTKKILKEIDPRYSSATALVDSILYIFGGRGCPSGRQEMTQRYYYDLYSLNIKTLQLKKLWEYPDRPKLGDFLPSSSMQYDKNNDCFYFFCNQEGGKLMKIERSHPTIEMMSLPIGFIQHAQYMYMNLFYSQEDSKLYALLQQIPVTGTSQILLYELNWPPVTLSSGTTSFESVKRFPAKIWAIILMLCGLALAGGIYSYLHFGKKKKAAGSIQNNSEEEAAGTVTGTQAIPEFHNYDFERSCIRFFGGFKVKDRQGNDITDIFTPTLKQLLILLILHTGNNGEGISGHKIIQTLWFDKTEESAKNNRNVYMSKLRYALEKVGDVKILNNNGIWSISFSNGAFCDYIETIKMFAKNDRNDLEKLLELLLSGAMLPNMENEFVDPFKNDFSSTTIDFLTDLLKKDGVSDALLLKISDTLFQYDFINEDALKYKCGILYRQGKKGLAKTVYDAFCKEYALSLGTPFPVSLLDLIK